MGNKSKLSVCIPTYNGEQYIKEQLESILMQLGENDEVIISDDRSTDQTIPIIESLNDKRIRIIVHPAIENKFGGTYKKIYYVYKNVENALAHATGDYIFLSDQDDIWLPGKVDKVVAALDKGAQLVFHNNSVVDNDRNVLMASYFDYARPSLSFIRLIVRPFYQGASMAFTKETKDRALPFPNHLIISHDHWIGYIAHTNGKNIEFIEEPLLLYRRHGNNVSSNFDTNTNSLYFKISYRFNTLIRYLSAKYRK